MIKMATNEIKESVLFCMSEGTVDPVTNKRGLPIKYFVVTATKKVEITKEEYDLLSS